MRFLSRFRTAALIVAACSCLHACQSTSKMTTTQTDFGAVEGQTVSLYTLTNANGLVAKITNYGATVTELHVPDRDGQLADIVLGFDSVEGYVERSPYFGAMCGRVGNRIAFGRFTLDGVEYRLATNNEPHHLHGGIKGFDKVIWDAETIDGERGPALRFTYSSPDGEEGYPGAVNATVVYTLTDSNELIVETTATTSAATPVNIVHHSYWNLGGHDAAAVLDHELTIMADRYTPVDATLIPTGALDPVAGTGLDFTTSKTIGRDIDQLPAEIGGYDHNYVLRGEPGTMRLAARIREPRSGRVMELHTTEPGMQFYTGNFLDGIDGKDGVVYGKHQGFCLETQRFPDTINKEGSPGWPSVVLRPGASYRHVMVHRFVVD